MIAIPRDDGGIEVHGSLQCPYYVHTALVRALGLEPERVVVVQEETGGAFGGKEDYPSILAIHAALLARKAGRPVRIAYDRHEDLAATTKRHPSVDPAPDGRHAGRPAGRPGHRVRARRRRVHHGLTRWSCRAAGSMRPGPTAARTCGSGPGRR